MPLSTIGNRTNGFYFNLLSIWMASVQETVQNCDSHYDNGVRKRAVSISKWEKNFGNHDGVHKYLRVFFILI